MHSQTDPKPVPPRDLALWVGILAGPLLWAINQQANYLLVYWARIHHAPQGLQFVTFGCGALSLVSAMSCWSVWRQAQVRLAAGGDSTWRRVAFMAGLGAWMSLFFVVAIVAFALPPLFLHPALR